jgi:hypothetical protein
VILASKKRQIEWQYLDEARRLSEVFPKGEPLEHDGERPDFRFAIPGGILGIEITELCRQEPRTEAARLAIVAPRARDLFHARNGGSPVNVSPVFSDHAVEMTVADLAQSLADFVWAHRDENRSFRWKECPTGYLHVGVFSGEGDWRYFRAGDTELATRDQVGQRIASKDALVPGYRRRATELWLLIVADQFLGPGELYVRPDHLTEWAFDYSFEKVLIFQRQPGGSGEILEVRRRSREP